MTVTSRSSGAGGLIRTVADLLRGPLAGGSSAGPFAERSRVFYLSARRWVHTSGTVALTTISALQGWRAGFGLASLVGVLAVHAFFRRDQRTSLTGDLVMDITAMGVAMVVVGIPTVAAVLAIIMTFLAALLLDRRKAALVSTYIVAWAAAAYVANTLWVEPTEPASNPVPWVASITLFGVVLVLVVSRRVVELIGELEILRAQFLGGVAHDLRNHLTAVTGAAAVLGNAGAELSEEDTADMIDMILRQAAEANRMVDDLLTSARLDASSLDLELRTVDVGQLVGETLTVAATVGGESPVDFAMPDHPILAWADPMRVSQVIQNLVSNALRYGNGHVRVTIENREDTVAVQVIDDGPGITENEQVSVFAPFARASQGRKHQASVGLGLSVARELSRLMGGDVTYRRVGGESVFELTIPPPVQSPSPEIVGRVDVVATDLAEVWLGDDGVLRVDYHPGVGIEDLEQAATLVEACATIADGTHLPLMVITGGLRPDTDARRLYTERAPTIANAVAIVVTGAPILTGIANLLTSRMGLNVPIRVFDNQIEALGWLTNRSGGRIHPTTQRLGRTGPPQTVGTSAPIPPPTT